MNAVMKVIKCQAKQYYRKKAHANVFVMKALPNHVHRYNEFIMANVIFFKTNAER